jgi:hypothetical protein
MLSSQTVYVFFIVSRTSKNQTVNGTAQLTGRSDSTSPGQPVWLNYLGALLIDRCNHNQKQNY